MSTELDKYHFFWQDPALVTSDNAHLEKGRNLIASLFGNDLFLNSTIQYIAQSYDIDSCAIDFIDLLSSSRQAFSAWSDKVLSSSKHKEHSARRLLVVRNAEQLHGNNLSELSELDILFRLTDKSSPYSNLLTLVTFKVDDLSTLQNRPPEKDNAAEESPVSQDFDWKAYLTDKWRPSFVEFNPTALIGRMSRGAVQTSLVPLPCPPQSPSVQEASTERGHTIDPTKCEILSSTDPTCHHADSLLDRLEGAMLNVRKIVDESLSLLPSSVASIRTVMLSSLGKIAAGETKVEKGRVHAMQATDAFALLGLVLLIVLLLRRMLVGNKKKRVKIVLPSDDAPVSNHNTQTHPTSALKKPKQAPLPEISKGKKVAFQSPKGVLTDKAPDAVKLPVKGRIQTPAAKGPAPASTPSPSSVKSTATPASTPGGEDLTAARSTRSRSPGRTPYARARTRGKATPAKNDDFIYT